MSKGIIIITRNYPPKTGGIEKFSYDLISVFSANRKTFRITLSKSAFHLFWFIPYAFAKAFYLITQNKIKNLHLCDALLSPIGLLLNAITGVKVSVTVHGLDITYPNPFYQAVIPKCLRKLDAVIPVSNATANECMKRGIPSSMISVIPNGIIPEEFYLNSDKEQIRKQLEVLCNSTLKEKTILTTVGRLVRRKGVTWFLENIIPELDSNFHYIVAGDGPEKQRIQDVVTQLGLQEKVTLLGRVSHETKLILLHGADICIMPNISIPGDVEGFGIIAIEAGACGTPVIAAKIQGIQDAVINGETGFLVEEKDIPAYLELIQEMPLKDREKIKKKVIEEYNWTKIFTRYEAVIFS